MPLRHVTLEPIEGEPPIQTENATNAEMQRKLQKRERVWRALAYTSAAAAFIFTVVVGYRVLCGG